MEPRPSRPSRATGQSSTRTTRTPWTPSPPVEPPTSQRTADIYSAPPNQGGQWYGQPGAYAPDPNEYRQTSPLTPIKPRHERSNKLLRYLLAALLLIGIIGGGAYAITRYLDSGGDKPKDAPVVASTDTTATPTQAPAEQTSAEQSAPTATTAPQPTATVAAEPTQPPAGEPVQGASTAQEAPATTASEATTTSDTKALLPAASALDGDWTITDEGERTKAEVAAAIGANGDELLTSWRWRDNFYRDLTRVDPASYPDETTYINVSIHRFANAEGAAESLTALSDIVVEAQGLQEIETPVIGDLARGLSGPGDGVNLYVLYVQDGKYLIRIGGSSVTGDPAATVNALAEKIVSDHTGST